MLTPMDDFLAHQIPETFDKVFTSDRNFYDRYYFNLHDSSGDLFMIVGMGQYPNLGVTDAFVALSYGDQQRVLRSSRELRGDRLDTTVGPITVEVLEGLKRLRVACQDNDAGFAFDVVFEGDVAAFEEPPSFSRHLTRVVSHTQRITQTGRWAGSLTIDGTTFEVEPLAWGGARDHSWGIRAVGEPEPPGIRAAHNQFNGFLHNWATIQTPEYAILYFIGEDAKEARSMDEAVRLAVGGGLGEFEDVRPVRHDIQFHAGSTRIKAAELTFTDGSGSPIPVGVEPLRTIYLFSGTGYGPEPDWRHGMYQGPAKTETRVYDLSADLANQMSGLDDTLCRFTIGDTVGYGVFETLVRGPYPRYGF